MDIGWIIAIIVATALAVWFFSQVTLQEPVRTIVYLSLAVIFLLVVLSLLGVGGLSLART